MVRRVGRTRCVVDKEGFVGGERVLLLDVADRPARHVLVEVVILGIWRFDGLGPLEDSRRKLARVVPVSVSLFIGNPNPLRERVGSALLSSPHGWWQDSSPVRESAATAGLGGGPLRGGARLP